MVSKDYKLLLVNLADQLHTEDVERIIFIQGLPKDYEKQSKLKMLLGLHMEGKIGEDKLVALEQVLNEIKRTDLAKFVKDFAKAQKKKTKKNPKPEQEKTQEGFKANMERAMLLIEWLQDQICYLYHSAETEDAQEVILDIKDKAEILKEKLKVAKSVNDNRYSEESSDSDGTPSPPDTLKRQHLQRELQATIATRPPAMTPNTGGQTMVKKPIPAVEDPEENVYEEVTAAPKTEGSSSFNASPSPKPQYENSAAIARKSSLLVAGRRPSPLPKPLPKPRTFSKKPKGLESDTDDYTGTSTSTTGDSGFSDVKPFLRTALKEESSSLETLESVTPTTTFSPADSTADGYYKTLHKEEVKISYYKSVRDNKYQEMMKDADTTESLSEEREQERSEKRVYENLRQYPPRR